MNRQTDDSSDFIAINPYAWWFQKGHTYLNKPAAFSNIPGKSSHNKNMVVNMQKCKLGLV